jgi:hypothetical protein
MRLVPEKVKSICAAMQQLKDVPTQGFGDKFDVTVAMVLMVSHVAPSTTVAVRVLHLLLTGNPPPS